MQRISDLQKETSSISENNLKSETIEDVLITARSDLETPIQVPVDTVVEDTLVVPSEWSCELCTYINSMEESLCSMCGNSRPGNMGDAAVSSGPLWFCPACTLLNPLTATRLVVRI